MSYRPRVCAALVGHGAFAIEPRESSTIRARKRGSFAPRLVASTILAVCARPEHLIACRPSLSSPMPESPNTLGPTVEGQKDDFGYVASAGRQRWWFTCPSNPARGNP
jgi:hypothetical protein